MATYCIQSRRHFGSKCYALVISRDTRDQHGKLRTRKHREIRRVAHLYSI